MSGSGRGASAHRHARSKSASLLSTDRYSVPFATPIASAMSAGTKPRDPRIESSFQITSIGYTGNGSAVDPTSTTRLPGPAIEIAPT